VDLGELLLIMFQCGINTRKIQRVVETIYGTYYSHASIARLTHVAEEEIEAWRMRPLKCAYFSIMIDAVFLCLRRGSYEKEPVYLAQDTDHEGNREILGFWVMGAGGESSYAWREIITEIAGGGVQRVDIFISDDLPGIEEATKSVFSASDHQLCVVHALRNTASKVRRKDRGTVLTELKHVYRASLPEGGQGGFHDLLGGLEEALPRRGQVLEGEPATPDRVHEVPGASSLLHLHHQPAGEDQ
jgi:putative transposase